jgi:carbon-monoxide dehydrogenase large subunit
VVCFIEGGAGRPKESARIEVNNDGTLSVYMGTSSVGQGVETVFAQIAADALEVPIERIHQVYHGSTGLRERRLRRLSLALDGDGRLGGARLPPTISWRSLRQAAGKRLGCAESNVTLDIDKVSGGGRSMAAPRVRRPRPPRARSSTRSTPTATARTSPTVTVDAELGRIEIVDYVVVQDVAARSIR